MQRTRNLVVALVVVALAITAVGTMVLGASGKTRIVAINGVPGARADICVNDRERASSVRYGKHVKLELNTAPKTIKFARAAGGRPCRGTLLGKTTIDAPDEGIDVTLVVTKKSPKKVLTFENATGPVPDDTFVFALRYAGNLGKVKMIAKQRIEGIPIGPQVAATASPWVKGDEVLNGADVPPGVSAYLKAVAKKDTTGRLLAKSPFQRLRPGKLNQTILIGDKPRNARFVQLRTTVPTPTPSPGP